MKTNRGLRAESHARYVLKRINYNAKPAFKSGCTSFRKRVANTRAGEDSADGKKGAAACWTGVRGLSKAWRDFRPNIWRCEDGAAAEEEAEAEEEVAGYLMVALGPLTPGNTAERLRGKESDAGEGSALW